MVEVDALDLDRRSSAGYARSMGVDPSGGVRSGRRRRREIAAAIAAEHSLAPRPRGLGVLARQVGALEAERTRSRLAGRRKPAAPPGAAAGH